MNFTLSIKEFENRYKKEKNARAKTRLHILLLRRKKYSQEEISNIVEVTQGTVSNVCRRFLKKGWKSVYDKHREGRPAALNNEQKNILKEAMNEEISDGEIRRGWQTKDVKNFINNNFEKTFTPQHIRRIMHKIGMSWKVPRPEHKNHDQKAVNNFKKNLRGRFCLWQMSTK